MKEYEWRGGTYQFSDGNVPKDATPVGAKQAPKPANKARKAPVNKGAKSATGGRKRVPMDGGSTKSGKP